MNGKSRLCLVLLILLLIFTPFTPGLAQNPISPPGVYIADPTARVWPDGRVWVYGSLDETTDYYCSHRHHALSSEDLLEWDLHRDVFASKGERDRVGYSDSLLYAPDCIYRDGLYYLYYCLASPVHPNGVGVSDSPVGPFENARNVDLYGYEQIDPGVFIDDDGKAYFLWGQFTLKMAELKPGMMEIDPETLQDSVLTEGEHFFHEGGYLVKRGDTYYLVYAHVGRAGRPTCIAYATSKKVMGPYKYGGVIVDNDHSDPAVWNNHGSIVEFKGQWYVFYHRSSHGTKMMRKACMEPIFFNPDGSIDEVEMTSQGAGPPLSATIEIDAARACLLYGHTRIAAVSENNEVLTGIRHEDYACFKYLDFGEGVSSVELRIRPGSPGGRIDIMTGQPWTRALGTVEVPQGNNIDWLTIRTDVEEIKDVHALWLRFSSENKPAPAEELFSIDWIKFRN